SAASIDNAEHSYVDEDEELDRELEKVAATFIHQPSSIETAEATPQDAIIINPDRESRLSFQFPGWGIDICKGAAISRHVGNIAIDSPSSSVKFAKKFFGAADNPGTGTYVYGIPEELWMHVLMRLNARELCSLRQTCRWFYYLASQDDAWLNTYRQVQKEEEERQFQSDLPRQFFLAHY
ncbi:hypothetical protein KI387_027123, partial [Taxus chinensis]